MNSIMWIPCQQRFTSNKAVIQKRNNDCENPFSTGEILQEGQSSSTVVYQATPHKRLKNIQKKKKGPKSSAPDFEARKDFWSIMGDSFCRNNATPSTNPFVLRDALSLKYSDRCLEANKEMP